MQILNVKYLERRIRSNLNRDGLVWKHANLLLLGHLLNVKRVYVFTYTYTCIRRA